MPLLSSYLELPAELMEPARISFHVNWRIPGYRRKLVLLKVMEVAVRRCRKGHCEIGRGNRITRRCAPRPPGRRTKAAGAQLGLRPSSVTRRVRTWLVLCRRFDPNGNINAELPRNNFFENGRGNRIRTCDPLVPNQMRYQTAPCPEPTHRRRERG